MYNSNGYQQFGQQQQYLYPGLPTYTVQQPQIIPTQPSYYQQQQPYIASTTTVVESVQPRRFYRANSGARRCLCCAFVFGLILAVVIILAIVIPLIVTARRVSNCHNPPYSTLQEYAYDASVVNSINIQIPEAYGHINALSSPPAGYNLTSVYIGVTYSSNNKDDLSNLYANVTMDYTSGTFYASFGRDEVINVGSVCYKTEVNVYIPSSVTFQSINMNVNSGYISLLQYITAVDMTLSSTDWDITMNYLTITNSLTVNTRGGNIYLDYSTISGTTGVALTATSGDIKIYKHTTVDGAPVQLTTNSGNIHARNGFTCSNGCSINANALSGDVKLEYMPIVNSDNSIAIAASTTSGDIKIKLQDTFQGSFTIGSTTGDFDYRYWDGAVEITSYTLTQMQGTVNGGSINNPDYSVVTATSISGDVNFEAWYPY